MKRITLLGLLLIFTFAWVMPATADQLSDAKQQKDYLADKANSLEKTKKQTQSQLKQVQSTKQDIINQQQQEKKRAEELAGQITAINAEIQDIDNSIKEAEDKYEKQKELLKTRLRVMYENTDNSSYIKAIVESKNIIDMFSKLKYISLISERDKDLVDSLVVEKKDVEYKKSLKEDEKYKKQADLNQKKVSLNNLQVSRAANDQKEKEIKAKLDLIEKQIDDANEQAQEIGALIKRLSSSKKKYSGGSMQWPTPGYEEVTSPFGWRVHPILKVRKFHSGIDIGVSYGVPIQAANKGTVVVAGWESGYGNTVVIDHGGGISTLYAHTSKILVSVGDEVDAGQVIAKVGSTGMSTGPHLHFEVIKDGTQVDPLGYVSP